MPNNTSHHSIQLNKKAFLTSVIILLVIITLAGTLTHIIPAGSFQVEVVNGRKIIVPGTFEFTGENGYPIWRWFTAPIEVLWGPDAPTVISIILFIMIIGGVFTLLNRIGMLQYVMNLLVIKYRNNKYKLMAILVFFFMFSGSTLGLYEELIALVPIAILLSYSMGWDSLTGLGMSFLAAGFGFTSAVLNPFLVGVAQELAGITVFSGIPFRVFIFAVSYLLLYAFLSRYAKKIENNPQSSAVYEQEQAFLNKYPHEMPLLTNADERSMRTTVLVFAITIATIPIFIVSDVFIPILSKYSLPIMAALLLIGGLIAAKVSNYKGSSIKAFLSGITALAPSTLIILMAMSVKLIIVNGGIMATVLYYASEAIYGMGPYSAVIIIYLITVFFNFFISSSSAKAFLLIPLIAPLTGLVGLTEQMAVQAFCLGGGFINMMFPTNPLLMVTLGITAVSYPQWFKFTYKIQLFMMAVHIAILMLAVAIGYGA